MENQLDGKTVYWDTNCYRHFAEVARKSSENDVVNLFEELHEKEKNNNIQVKASYLAMSELLTHLSDDTQSDSHKDCKLGLSLLMNHINKDLNNLMLESDDVFSLFFDAEHQINHAAYSSFFNFVLHVIEFTDEEIQNIDQSELRKPKNYLDEKKRMWTEAFTTHILQNNFPNAYKNNSSTANYSNKTQKLFNQLKQNGDLYKLQAVGLYQRIKKPANYLSDEYLISKTIKRFKPLFDLIYIITHHICSKNGYNFSKKENDIIDFLIVANLEPSKTTFVSNETKKLVPRLKELGHSNDVWTLEEYFEALNIDFPKQ